MFRKHQLLFAEGDGDVTGGGGGGGNPGDGSPPAGQEWYTGLPEDLKGDAAVFETFKDQPVTAVLKAYRDMSKASVESAPPAKADDYQFSPPDFMKDVPIEMEVLKTMREEAFAEGLSRKGFQLRMENQAKRYLAALDSDKKEALNAEKELKEKWGDKYDENVALTVRVVNTLDEDLKKIIQDRQLGSHPHFVRLIHQVAQARREGQLHTGDTGATRLPTAEVFYGKPATT